MLPLASGLAQIQKKIACRLGRTLAPIFEAAPGPEFMIGLARRSFKLPGNRRV